MTIEAEWEDLWRKNSPHNIFTDFSHYFEFSLDETSLQKNEGELQVIVKKNKHRHEKNAVTQGFQ